jgi:DNA-binding winged helix-turn-helix (wHTH) protein/TolB-like protein/Flp pilus assembly protein TadD
MAMSDKIRHFYEFDDFRLDAENHTLWRGGEPVQVFPKALEVLFLLLDKKGEIVSREELLKAVWQDTYVEEANINYTVSLLRKTLGKKNYIQTIPKRGYRFSAEVREVSENGKPKVSENGKAALAAPVHIESPPKAQIRWLFMAVILFSLFFLTSFVWWWNSDGGRRGLSSVPVTKRNIRTVAILPLKTLNQNEQSQALSLGLTDSLISRLGSLNRFAVRPFSSVKDYTENDQNPLKFGETLKADAVLEGTLQQAGTRLRVNVRLWDVRDGAQLWQDSFDAAEGDLFRLQDAIATRVTQSLVSELLEKDRQLLTKRYTDSPEAFRAYVRGRAILDSKNPDNFEKAIDELDKATTLDPTFALAYVGFADAFTRLGFQSAGAEAEQFYAKSKASVQKALALDPELAEAYTALGSIQRIHEWDWADAEQNFRRAIELNPNYAKAHLWYALLLSCLGRHDEALVEIKLATEIDPLSPDVKSGYLAVLEGRGEYSEALTLARQNIKLNKEYRIAKRGVATFLFHLGEYPEAIQIAEEELPQKNSQKFVWLSLLATAYHRTGQAEKRDEKIMQLEELARTEPKALYALAENYTELGWADKALSVLEKCFELREERLMWLKVEPRFAGLRSDARFQQLLQKMNLAAKTN